ncbi:hypothetical protein CsSME_00024556 [Camellia sinensis var. sinensis]
MLVLQGNPSVDELRLGTARKNEALFGASIEELSLEQLKELKAKLMEVREKVTNKLVELLKEANGGGGSWFLTMGRVQIPFEFSKFYKNNGCIELKYKKYVM